MRGFDGMSRFLSAGVRRLKQSVKVLAAAGVVTSAMAVGTSHAGTPLRVHYYPNIFVMLPIWVAQEKGLFTAQGIDAEMFDILGGTVAMTALAGKSIDVLQIPPNYTIVYNNKNPEQRVTQVAALYGAPIYSLVGLNDLVAGCEDAKKPYPAPINCMKGKKIGVVALGSDNYQVILSLLAQAGLTDKDVAIVPTGTTVATVNMLRTAQIDYGIMAEPHATQILETKLVQELVDISNDPLMKPWIGNASYALTAAVKQEPEKFHAYARAIGEAVKFIHDDNNADELRTILLKYVKVEPEIATAMLKRSRANFSAANDCQAIANQAQWLINTDQLEDGQAPKCEDFVLPDTK